MTCWLEQRIPYQERGEGRKFIDFQKLHTLSFVRIKFQVNRRTLNFDGFLDPPRRLEGMAPGWGRHILKQFKHI